MAYRCKRCGTFVSQMKSVSGWQWSCFNTSCVYHKQKIAWCEDPPSWVAKAFSDRWTAYMESL